MDNSRGHCLGGAVHDLNHTDSSVRHELKESFPDIVKSMLGRRAWLAASIATFFQPDSGAGSTSVVVVNAPRTKLMECIRHIHNHHSSTHHRSLDVQDTARKNRRGPV
jgi:hypothetical protein